MKSTYSVVLLLAVFHLWPVTGPAEEVLVIAHRGASAAAPENTLAAIREAVRVGADAVEIDVRMSADGQVVVMHDARVDRTTNGRGRVERMSLEQIRRLDAGSWFGSRFSGESVPTLSEVLRVLEPHETLLIIEFKVGGTRAPGIEAKVVSAVRESAMSGRTIVKAFDLGILERLAELAPQLPRLYVYAAHLSWINLTVDDGIRFGDVLQADAQWLQGHRVLLGRRFVARAQRAGYRFVAWDVHTRARMEKMLSYGVDAIETDHPDLLLRLTGRSPSG